MIRVCIQYGEGHSEVNIKNNLLQKCTYEYDQTFPIYYLYIYYIKTMSIERNTVRLFWELQSKNNIYILSDSLAIKIKVLKYLNKESNNYYKHCLILLYLFTGGAILFFSQTLKNQKKNHSAFGK